LLMFWFKSFACVKQASVWTACVSCDGQQLLANDSLDAYCRRLTYRFVVQIDDYVMAESDRR
jgi:hypothetical protein